MSYSLPESDDAPLKHLLYKRICTTKHPDHFAVQYRSDVDPRGFDARRALKVHHVDAMTVWLMPGDVAVCERGEQWSAFETKARVERNAHIARWADFSRGHWTLEVPKIEGTYLVAPKDSSVTGRAPFSIFVEHSFRTLSLCGGVVRDSVGFTSTERSVWRGYWYSEPLPLLLAPVRAELE